MKVSFLHDLKVKFNDEPVLIILLRNFLRIYLSESFDLTLNFNRFCLNSLINLIPLSFIQKFSPPLSMFKLTLRES